MMSLSETMLDQLYVAPGWIGRGLGSRLLAVAKERRPGGLDLYTFQANVRARRFYEARGFVVVATGDGAGNEEGQPDIRYAWRPAGAVAVATGAPTAPDLVVPSPDGTPIAVFATGAPDGPPLLLVHGTTADHTTFRTIGPRLGDRRHVSTRWTGAVVVRRATRSPYAIEREFEDVAAVAEALARRRPATRSMSSGTRTAAGPPSGRRSGPRPSRRVVCYEGAPSPAGRQLSPARHRGRPARPCWRRATGTRPSPLFLAEVVGMSDTGSRRLSGQPGLADPRGGRRDDPARTRGRGRPRRPRSTALGRVRQPVLQLLGSASIDVFHQATRALDDRLADGRVVVIEGARHAAHHTHPDAVVDAIRTFLS